MQHTAQAPTAAHPFVAHVLLGTLLLRFFFPSCAACWAGRNVVRHQGPGIVARVPAAGSRKGVA